MNFETKPRIGRGTRRTALGASLAMAAVGALAAPALAAETLTVAANPQSGTAFNVTAGGLTTGTQYQVILTTTAGDTINQAEDGTCRTATAATGATWNCTIQENSAGSYVAKLIVAGSPATALASQNVTITGTTGAVTAPTATDGALTADSVRLTRTEGVIWTVNSTDHVLAANEPTKDVPVTTGSALVTVKAAPGYALPAGQRTSWAFKFSTTATALQVVTPPAEGSATAPKYADLPTRTQDTVTVTRVTGIDWYINNAPVTFVGDATTATVHTTAENPTVEARAADGYVFPDHLAVHWYAPKFTDVAADPTLTRLAGENRMDTAVEISKKYWTNADTVYVANGLRFADALTAGPAAAKDRGPLLLAMQDSVPANVLDEIRRLKPARIHIVGGTSVVSSGVESTLSGIAPVTRLAGGNRYETAAAVSSRWANDSKPVVYVAFGENYPDALSGGSGAAHEEGLLLLSPGNTLSQPTVDTIRRVQASKVVVVGGTNVLADLVRLQAEDLVGDAKVFRYAGADRYATSAAVADKSGSANPADKTLFLATGLNFPDALAGVPAAHKVDAPLFLTQPTCVPPAVKTEINKMTAVTEQVRLGSSGVLGNFPLTQVCAS